MTVTPTAPPAQIPQLWNIPWPWQTITIDLWDGIKATIRNTSRPWFVPSQNAYTNVSWPIAPATSMMSTLVMSISLYVPAIQAYNYASNKTISRMNNELHKSTISYAGQEQDIWWYIYRNQKHITWDRLIGTDIDETTRQQKQIFIDNMFWEYQDRATELELDISHYLTDPYYIENINGNWIIPTQLKDASITIIQQIKYQTTINPQIVSPNASGNKIYFDEVFYKNRINELIRQWESIQDIITIIITEAWPEIWSLIRETAESEHGMRFATGLPLPKMWFMLHGKNYMSIPTDLTRRSAGSLWIYDITTWRQEGNIIFELRDWGSDFHLQYLVSFGADDRQAHKDDPNHDIFYEYIPWLWYEIFKIAIAYAKYLWADRLTLSPLAAKHATEIYPTYSENLIRDCITTHQCRRNDNFTQMIFDLP